MIYLRNTTRKHHLRLRALERDARALLAAAGEPGSSLSLSFVGDAAIRRLNREHRGKDTATDVLSFPLFEAAGPGARRAAKPVPPGAPERLLGDVVISVDTAWRQAREYDAPLQAEVERLLIHGLLHLLGHDHEEPRERARMVREERRLAAVLGLPWPYDA
ncbi:MAG: rRNA maturation RNase YbeY [Candidatus Baltobacteraceae bacterium]